MKLSMFLPDDSQEKTVTNDLDAYYEEVVSHLRDAEEIMIFGPGEAKGELLKRIERDDLRGRTACVETADNMTVPQIAAKVRNYFQASMAGSAQGERKK